MPTEQPHDPGSTPAPGAGPGGTAAPWDVDPVFACSGEMARRMGAHPWNESVLGAPEAWPQALRAAVSILLRSKYPMILSWGPDFVMLYNDAFIPTLGDKHPGALGGRLAEQFSEIWDEIRPLQQAVLEGGEATWDEDLPLVIERGQGPEETFFTFSYSAVPDDDRPGGVLAVLSVTTPEVVGARRLALLNDVGSVAAADVDAVAHEVARVLEGHRSEVPGCRVWLSRADEVRPVATCGDAGPLPDRPAPPTDLDAPGGPDRIWLPIGSDGAGLLEVVRPPLRPLDAGHRQFLRQLAQQVGQQLDIAHARGLEVARARGLAELDAAKTQFLSTMSHELRTPLTLLVGPLEDLASGHLDSLGPDRAVELLHQGRRLLGMVDDLLEVARAESGRLTPVPEPVDAGPYTARVVAPLLESGARAGLEVVQRWDEDAPCLLDLRLWENVVVNLVGNAIKYTLAGRVEVALDRDGSDLVLTVRDTGIGIPAEEQPLVFQRFHRVRTDEGRTIEGAGIGLAIVADAVQALEGSLDLLSTPGVGTEITVRLPGVVIAHPTPHAVGHPSEDRLASVTSRAESLVPHSTPSERPAADPDAPLLLVVDDNPAMRAHVADCLEGLGTVLVAGDGLEALEILGTRPIALVVSDVMMPRLDGEGLLSRIRAHPVWCDLPVVLLSARAETAAAVSGLDRGADDYVAKPFSREELVARVRAHLELASLRRETQRRRDRDTMLAGVSHDMQTPLTVILTGLGMLDAAALAPREADLLRRVRRSSEDLRGMISEMLDSCALALGHAIRVRVEQVDLAALVADVVRVGPPAVDVVVSPGCLVLADALRLRRILTNLLDNATRVGAERVQVAAWTEPLRPDVVEVLVVDDGPGMAAEVADGAFDAWKTGTPEGRGRGLGLFVSRESARCMGGDLALRSTGPGGSSFLLTLPACAPVPVQP